MTPLEGTAVPDGDVTYVYNTFRLTALGAKATTTITGNNGLYRRRVFEQVMFDQGLREGEDVDINHQLLDHGYRLACIQGLEVEHSEHKSLPRSVVWLYESGRGASRQLFRYRKLRPPHFAFVGMLGVLVITLLARSKHRLISRLLLPAYLVATSERHLHGRFATSGPAGYRKRYIGAVVVNAGLIAAYFAGRVVGVVHYCLRSESTTAR